MVWVSEVADCIKLDSSRAMLGARRGRGLSGSGCLGALGSEVGLGLHHGSSVGKLSRHDEVGGSDDL